LIENKIESNPDNLYVSNQKQTSQRKKKMNTWMQMYELTLRGARWGDLEVYDVEENLEILTKPSRKEQPKLVTIIVRENIVREQKHLCVSVDAKKKTFTEKLALFSRTRKVQTRVLLQCKSCLYARHTTPPDNFTDEQKEYCCAFCMLSCGKNHGARCQQIEV
jgi:hypothetical protein